MLRLQPGYRQCVRVRHASRGPKLGTSGVASVAGCGGPSAIIEQAQVTPDTHVTLCVAGIRTPGFASFIGSFFTVVLKE